MTNGSDSPSASALKGRLFPAGLPECKWVDFEADGFVGPVTGIIYRKGSVMPGMPLGGLGTGFISLGTDGTLDYVSTIFNEYGARWRASQAAAGPISAVGEMVHVQREHVPTRRLPFLGISVEGNTRILTLRSKKGTEIARGIEYWGHYPVADLEYETDLPVSVGLRVWSSFFPGDAVASNTPGATFEVRLVNDSDQEKRGTLAFSFEGPRELDIGIPANISPTRFERQLVAESLNGVAVSAEREGIELGYALAVAGDHRVRLGAGLGASAIKWNNIPTELPATEAEEPGASIAVDFELAAGEAKTVRFVLAWYAPVWRSWYGTQERFARRLAQPEVGPAIHWEQMPERRYVNLYQSRFSSALDIARHIANEHDSLLSRIIAWQQVVYDEDRLPGWLRDSLVNIFHIFAQQSFWIRSTDQDHRWGSEGFFTVNESLLSCPQQSCLANNAAGNWPLDMFFPELARNNLREFKYLQKPWGLVPSTLGPGAEPDMAWYEQQTSFDGQIYVHLVNRIWDVTGDDGILEEFYGSIKAQTNFLKLVDQDGDGLVDVWGNSQYYDAWPTMSGAAIHIAGYWLATLRVVERMAEKMGDQTFAEDCRAWYERGSKSMEEKLWNEPAGSYLLFHNTSNGERSDTVLSDQLVGQWLAQVHNLPSIFADSRVDRVLETIWGLNVASTPYGVRTGLHPDGATDRSGYYSSLMVPSYSSLVPAMLMINSGDEERGVELMHRVWRHLVIDLPMAWDMPVMLRADGEHAWGLEYFHNTMLWVLPIAILGQDLATFAAPGGMIDRVVRAAREC